MEQPLAKFGMLLLISFCSGCAGVTSAIDKNMGGLNSAEPLNLVAKGTDISNLQITKRYLMSVIGESYIKCAAYERRLLLGARSTNAGFDVATTVFSALATAFTPIGTVHALTASAAISSGSKTAIDTDIYENATAPLMIQAIDETYGINMDALETRLENDKNPDISYLVRIMSTHNQCSLSAASAKMQTLLSQQKTGNSTSAGASFATK